MSRIKRVSVPEAGGQLVGPRAECSDVTKCKVQALATG